MQYTTNKKQHNGIKYNYYFIFLCLRRPSGGPPGGLLRRAFPPGPPGGLLRRAYFINNRGGTLHGLLPLQHLCASLFMCAVYEYVRRQFIPKKQKQYIFMNLICNIILLVVFTVENRMLTIIANANSLLD